MRVLLLIKSMGLGGAEKHLCDLANALVDHGHEVWVAAAFGRLDRQLKPAVHRVFFVHFFPFYPVSVLYLAFLARRHKIEIIHGHQRQPIFIGCLISLMTGIPVVATLHGRFPHHLDRALVRRSLRRLIVVAPYWLEKIGLTDPRLGERSVYIPNGVKLSAPRGERHGHPVRLLYASRLSRSHATVIVLLLTKVLPRLCQDFPDLELEVAGTGRYYARLHKLAAKLNLQQGRETARLLGFQDDLTPVIARADITLGVGRVALEALAAGIPLLPINDLFLGKPISRENYPRMAFNNFLARDSSPPQPDSLYRAIRGMLEDYLFWLDETHALQAVVQHEYGLPKVVAAIMRVYEEVLKENGKPK